MNALSRFLVATLSLVLLACNPLPAPLSGPQAERPAASQVAPRESTTFPLEGSVDFSAVARTTQAIPGDVINLATISLIDTSVGQTRASGLTDAGGTFSLPFSTYNPAVGQTFILEAVKGLNAQLPGNEAPRFRTIVQYTATGWASVTNKTAPGGIVINALTTAVSLISGLDQANVPYASASGMVNALVNPPALTGTPTFPGHPNIEFLNLSNDVLSLLNNNLDPVANTPAVKPTLTAITPSTAAANLPVVITGSGFVPGATTVTIGGATAAIMALSATRLVAAVPAAAISGTATVTTTRGGTSNALAFTSPDGSAVALTTISPNPARPGQTVTIAGQGFTSVLANNDVRLNGVQIVPIFANQSSLVINLPSDCQSGNVSVTVAGAKSNNFYLTVDVLSTPIITSLFPSVGAVKSVVSIKGTNLGPTGKVVMGGYQAKVVSWSPKVIRAEVPFNVNPGVTNVTVFAPLGVATTTFTVINGDAAASFIGVAPMISTGGHGMYVWVGDGKLWTWGGANSTAVNYMNLNADGSFKDAAWSVSTLTLPYGTNQDDNPNAAVQVKNRVYYTVSNTSNKVNFATLEPYTGDVTGFGYDPTNDLPPTWLGKDLALAASDKYVYILGQGVSCSSALGGTGCGGRATTTMQTRILPSGGIGIWSAGPDTLYYGEDAMPFYIGGVLHLIGGNDSAAVGSQYSVINYDGTMGTWKGNPTPLVSGSPLSSQMTRVGRYYYMFEYTGVTKRGQIIDDLVLKPLAAYGTASPVLGYNRNTIVAGKYVYVLGDNAGSANQRAVWRCTLN